MAPYPSVARLSWGFEIPQTESALVQVLNAIDVVVSMTTKWMQPEVRWDNPAKAYYPMPVGWRARATWPTQDLVKQVKRTVATTSESSQLPLSSSSPGVLREKAKGDLTGEALALFNRLGWGRSLWIFHGVRRGTREIERSLWIWITCGFCAAGWPRREEIARVVAFPSWRRRIVDGARGGAPQWPLSHSSTAIEGWDDARGGAHRHGRFPTQA